MRHENRSLRVWITVLEASEMLGISRQRVHQLLNAGALTGEKNGTIWLISVRSIEQRQALLREEENRINEYRQRLGSTSRSNSLD